MRKIRKQHCLEIRMKTQFLKNLWKKARKMHRVVWRYDRWGNCKTASRCGLQAWLLEQYKGKEKKIYK